jgi:cytoskeletal protein CcmA (bactofilin family)
MSQPSSPAATAARSITAANFISEDVEIKGALKFTGDLVSNGHIDGTVEAGGVLTVGVNGEVKGDVRASAVAVHGMVKGNITVSERCELRGNAELVGDLDAPRLMIEEGVTLVGNVKVQPKGSADAAKGAKPPGA